MGFLLIAGAVILFLFAKEMNRDDEDVSGY